MRTLKPQTLTDYETGDVERQLMKAFYSLLFLPIFDVLEDKNPQILPAKRAALREIKNATEDALRQALRTGAVQYIKGEFSGKFSAAIVKGLRAIGGKLNKTKGTYTLDEAKVPAWVKAEAAVYQSSARLAHEAVRAKLDEIQVSLSRITGDIDASKTVDRVNEGFEESAGKALEIMPELTDAAKAALAKDYSINMDLWIQKWCEETIQELRETVEDNAMEGYRFDSLIAGIRGRYGVSMSKAKFLARQETGLFMSKYRQGRFKDAGITRYIWDTAGDGRVREDHKHLDGKIFAYANPPIVDASTGRRANPGQDYNCRCVDRPILDRVPEGVR